MNIVDYLMVWNFWITDKKDEESFRIRKFFEGSLFGILLLMAVISVLNMDECLLVV